MTSIDIMARRARVFELWAQGLKPADIQDVVAGEHGVSERTVRADIQTMKNWLPELVKIRDTSDDRASELLGLNQLIRQRLMNLAETSKHDPSRVGALKGSLESIKNEMTFLQSLGKIDKVADKLQADVKGDLRFVLEAWRPEYKEDEGDEDGAEG